ncbi:MAG: hypothetical protein QNJ29_12070 [Rhizobiaceae bacterium]|nr:hypothetical protein [Rhizobiaceae bacterium]
MDDGSQTICLDADEIRILERREAIDLGIPHFKAHLRIFATAIGVSVLYLAFWAVLFLTGKSTGWVAQLFIASLAIVLPLLFAAAFLRYQTIRAQLVDGALVYHPGWPKDTVQHLAVSQISSANVHKDFIDTLLGSGDLIICGKDGHIVELESLGAPEELLHLIKANRS